MRLSPQSISALRGVVVAGAIVLSGCASTSPRADGRSLRPVNIRGSIERVDTAEFVVRTKQGYRIAFVIDPATRYVGPDSGATAACLAAGRRVSVTSVPRPGGWNATQVTIFGRPCAQEAPRMSYLKGSQRPALPGGARVERTHRRTPNGS